MTSRIGQPDTDADLELRLCLDQQPQSCFVMVAGAGSGKTTSLVKALDYLAQKRGREFKRRGQQIACITYTEVAVGEIAGDVGDSSLFHVSTIHSFLWTVVRPYQSDLRSWVDGRISEKIADAEERFARPRTQAKTKEKLTADIARYKEQLGKLADVSRFTYGTGSDYAKGVLGHDDILRVGPSLIERHPLLRALVARQYPVIFVDESQDTNPDFVNALRCVATTVGKGFCLGFFGDPMQKIYMEGAGPISREDGWNQITKPENFRCPTSVLNVVNRIRAEDDQLEQVRGRTIEQDGAVIAVEGTARMFILPADDRRSERLLEVRKWLATKNDDAHWLSNENDAEVRALVLVHRMAAKRLGFPNIYSALNDKAPENLKGGLLDGTAWVLRPFVRYLLPLAAAARGGNDFEVMSALRQDCPLLTKERLAGQNAAQLLATLKENVDRLVAMFTEGSNATIREVITFVHQNELAALDEKFIVYLDGTAADDEEEDLEEGTRESTSINSFLDCAATELLGYREYIEHQSPYATQQGVKGAEFQRVLVVLDDEESAYNQFSYGKYFGITSLSDTDRKNAAEGKDTIVARTRRLFYVCCSRAVQDLAVILFVPDPAGALAAVVAKGFFRREDIHSLLDLSGPNVAAAE